MEQNLKMDISIIIPSYNTKSMLSFCINSIIKWTKGISYEIVVVDNGSTDGTVEEMIKRQAGSKNIKVIFNKKNLGFAGANNQGSKAAQGKYLLFLNSDTLFSDNILVPIVNWMEKNSKTGVVTCSLKNRDGSIQGTGGYFPTLIRVFSWMTIQDIPFVDYLIKPFHPFHGKSFSQNTAFYKNKKQLDWVTGAFLLTKKKIIDDIGGWDEKYFMYVEEVDLCFRIKKQGWQVWYLPEFNILHYGGASGTKESSVLSEFSGIKRFYRKFYPAWQYPLLKFFLKLGALGRIVLFGILEGKEEGEIYAKAFREA